MGTLGLAWTGDLKNAGGVCEKNGVSEFMCLYFYLIENCVVYNKTSYDELNMNMKEKTTKNVNIYVGCIEKLDKGVIGS